MATGSIIPQALRPGDTVAFISPSMRLNNVLSFPLERAKKHLESLKYRVRVIFQDLNDKPYLERVQARCDEVHNAFRDAEVNAIICTIGGSSCNELLAHLDYAVIRENPKIFCGYSDITLLHCAIFTQTGLQTFYGPSVLAELGTCPGPMPFTVDHLLAVLTGSSGSVGPVPRSERWAGDLPAYFLKDPAAQEVQELKPSPAWRWLRPGTARGRLMGGCFPSLLRLAGTPYWPVLDDRILFLETPLGEQRHLPYSLREVRSNLADLANIGVFRQIRGLVIGRPYQYDEDMRRELGAIVLEMCHGTDFPILLNVDVGHTSPMLTLPLNVLSSLDSHKDEFCLLEQPVLLEQH